VFMNVNQVVVAGEAKQDRFRMEMMTAAIRDRAPEEADAGAQ